MLYFFMVTNKSCTPNHVEGFLAVYEDMVGVLPGLKILLTKDFLVEDLLCGALSCSEACLFFSNDLLRLQLQSVHYYFMHDFSWVADQADLSVVLALLYVAFLGNSDDQGLGQRGWPFSCLPDLVADCRESRDISSPPAWTSSAGMLSTSADFPFFNGCTATSTSLRRMGWPSCVFVLG